MLPVDLKQKVLEAARREPSPPRRAVLVRTAVLLATAAASALGVLFAIGGVRAAPRPASLIVATAGGAAAIALAALLFSFGRGRSMLGRPRALLLAMVVGTPVALFAWKVLWSACYADMMVDWPARVGYRCLHHSLEISAVPLLVFVVLRRRSDPTHPGATGAALGVATGACAWVLIDLWCPVAWPHHLLIGHVLPLLLLAACGLWLGRRFLSIRAR